MAAAALGTAAIIGGLGLVNAQSAAAAGEWCNHDTCLSINTDGRFVGRIETSVWSYAAATTTSHVWSTNGQIDFWTKTEYVDSLTTYRDFRDVNQTFPPGTRICAEGWHNGQSVGLPCVTITDGG